MTGQLRRQPWWDALLRSGRAIFALAIAALGVETWVCAQRVEHALGPRWAIIPVIPWLPAVPWFGHLWGAIWIACAAGLLAPRARRLAGLVLGSLLFLSTLILEVPKNAAAPGNISLRTGVFEPLSLGCLAWLLPGPGAIPKPLAIAARYLLAVSMVVFGIDHWLALAPIGRLLPAWIPWHVFWIAFFGAGFIAAAVSIAWRVFERAGAALLGLMFAIWVVTLHLPRVLGLYGIPGAPANPNEWSSLLIALGLWGGLWALAGLAAR